MGEYATNPRNGKRIKLGTCEDLMYVTRADLEALHAAGWRGDGMPLTEYLKEQGNPCRVRLTPSYQRGELAGDPSAIEGREPEASGYSIVLDDAAAEAIKAAEHGTVCLHKAGTNFMVPCPLGAEPCPVKTSFVSRTIHLCMEGIAPVRAIYRCPFCGYKFNMRGEAIQYRLAELFHDQWGKGQSRIQTYDAKHYDYLRGLILAGAPETAEV